MSSTQRDSPKVLIVGAGLAGLLLAQLLERANIEYHVYERASKIKPLGAAMTLGPTILPVFEQLGLLEDLKKVSHEVKAFVLRDETTKIIGSVALNGHKEISGYEGQLFARPALYDLMLSRVPAEKITLGTKVLRVEEKDDMVTIHCADNITHTGHILVGADGAYSSVRNSIYEEMTSKGLLPKSDSEDLVAGYTTLVGVTEPLDLAKYPMLAKGSCDSEFMGGNGRSWVMMTVPGNKIAWACSLQFQSVAEAKRQRFSNAEWGPEANAAMIKEFQELPIPYGNGKMGDLFDMTPAEMISKVYLEHKMFDTWYHKRSVLVGDACHKMLPAAGQGAVNAMQDSVILANCLYDLKDNTQASITEAFKSYRAQRWDHAREQYDNSKFLAKVVGGLSWSERLVRTIFLNLPKWVVNKTNEKMCSYRPQVTFLPLAPFHGTGPVLPQLPSVRYAKEQEEKKKHGSVVV